MSLEDELAWQQRARKIKRSHLWAMLQRDHKDAAELLDDIDHGRAVGPATQVRDEYDKRKARQDKALADFQAARQADMDRITNPPKEDLPWDKPSGRPW